MNHYITDLDGNLLEVTDLKEAIFQVAMYLTYLYDQPSEEQAIFAIRRTKYWKDIYTKLNLLRIKQSLTA
ncbi:MAG: hypothetical protein P0Y49_13695 [Candidatus Pedobacter colombiensis]|uniref:Uncharacterized protein n=1 Tax=Candidatus Pedobacter colombiensis TaxID=3121371 RepID=A0AAJ6B4P6_9SPHI|nr:hypothetical protein [Pedobacter sp.]WEK17852.1 MAG: hypothetical protein P0Y49_13695 [Pedobacter sp.]